MDEVRARFDDPIRLAELAPLVEEIIDLGDVWRWQLITVSRLGMTATPRFTTRIERGEKGMAFAPDPALAEPAQARGLLTVTEEGGGARVTLDLEASVDLPLPGLMRSPVTSVVDAVLRAGGRRFASNLHLDLGRPEREGLRVRNAPRGAPLIA